MKVIKQEGCRDLVTSRRMKKEMDLQKLLSFESCRSPTVDHIEERRLESPRKRHDVQEVMDETAGKAMRGRGEDAWRLEPEGENGDAGNQSRIRRGGRCLRGPFW